LVAPPTMSLPCCLWDQKTPVLCLFKGERFFAAAPTTIALRRSAHHGDSAPCPRRLPPSAGWVAGAVPLGTRSLGRRSQCYQCCHPSSIMCLQQAPWVHCCHQPTVLLSIHRHAAPLPREACERLLPASTAEQRPLVLKELTCCWASAGVGTMANSASY